MFCLDAVRGQVTLLKRQIGTSNVFLEVAEATHYRLACSLIDLRVQEVMNSPRRSKDR